MAVGHIDCQNHKTVAVKSAGVTATIQQEMNEALK